MVAEKALESKCKDCEKIKKMMTDPEAPYLKGARLSPDILYLCFKCAAALRMEKNTKND